MGTCFDVYVTKENGRYRMDFSWRPKKSLAVTFSDDGLNWETPQITLAFDETTGWEDDINRNCVLKIDGKYKMWYTGQARGFSFIGYAESDDGINWMKSRINPIFVSDKNNIYEQERVGGCQVVKTEDMGYVMFYIGYENVHKAQICMAKSDNGITQWTKSPLNPVVSPDGTGWDGEACYKPSFLWNEEENKWMLWYNGRNGDDEYIGCALKQGRDLF